MADPGRNIMRRIINDVKVKLDGEFSKNFERQAFFSEAWQRRKSPVRANKTLLVKSGALRRSIRGKADESGVTFSSDLPQAAVHNNGGEIRVTPRMKRFFRAKFYEASHYSSNAKSRRQLTDGGFYALMQKQKGLSAEAQFYGAMALMKVGSVVRIPKRRFLGISPEVEKIVREVVTEGLKEVENMITKQLKELEK